MRTYKKREDYRELLVQTKSLFPTILQHIEIEKYFLCASYAKKSRYIARIHSNRPPWSLLAKNRDYVIECWGDKFDSSPLYFQIHVLLHELLHVHKQGHIQGNKFYRHLVHHDLEDFTFLRKVYGVNLEHAEDTLKGEKFLLKPKGELMRFPRLLKVK